MESNFEWITANGDIGIRFFHSIDDGGYSNPPHWHNDLEIIYLLEGRLKVRFGDGGERQIGADELLVINSGTIHAVTAYPNQAGRGALWLYAELSVEASETVPRSDGLPVSV